MFPPLHLFNRPVKKIAQNSVVFVLADTIVGSQQEVLFSQTIVRKEMIQNGYYSIGPFTGEICLVNQVIHLTGYSFAANAEKLCCSRRFEVNWSNLMGFVRGIEAVVRNPRNNALSPESPSARSFD